MRVLGIIRQFLIQVAALASKIAAHILYFEICFVYYSSRGVGFVIYLITFSFALFNEGLDPIRVLCLLYVSYLIGLMVMIGVLLRSKKVEEWLYREVGTEKVRKKLYNSPFLLYKTLKVLSFGATGLVTLECLTYTVKTTGSTIQSNMLVQDIQRQAAARNEETWRTTTNYLESIKGKVTDVEFAEIFQSELYKVRNHTERVDEQARLDCMQIRSQLKPEKGLIAEINAAVKETIMYDNTTKIVISGIENGASVARSWVPWA